VNVPGNGAGGGLGGSPPPDSGRARITATKLWESSSAGLAVGSAAYPWPGCAGTGVWGAGREDQAWRPAVTADWL
jgi:hypothetical protein